MSRLLCGDACVAADKCSEGHCHYPDDDMAVSENPLVHKLQRALTAAREALEAERLEVDRLADVANDAVEGRNQAKARAATAEAALEKEREWKRRYNLDTCSGFMVGDPPHYEPECVVYKEKLSAAEAALAGAREEWISVAERLPEAGEDVLLLGVNGARQGYYIKRTDYDGIYWVYGSSSGQPERFQVTHWRPLPPLPASSHGKGEA